MHTGPADLLLLAVVTPIVTTQELTLGQAGEGTGPLMTSRFSTKEGQVLTGSTHLGCALNIFLNLDLFPGLVERGAIPSPKPSPSSSPTSWVSAFPGPDWRVREERETSCRLLGLGS